MQLAVEAAVLDRRRRLAGDGGDQRHVLAGERLAALAAAEREHRDRRLLRDTRHEVVDAGVAPVLDFFGGEAA